MTTLVVGASGASGKHLVGHLLNNNQNIHLNPEKNQGISLN